MREREQPIVQTMTASAVSDSWSEILDKVSRKETRVIVEKSGIPVAAIVSVEDLEWLNQLDERRQEALTMLDASQAAFAGEPPEQVKAEIRKAIAAVRRDNRHRERPQQSA